MMCLRRLLRGELRGASAGYARAACARSGRMRSMASAADCRIYQCKLVRAAGFPRKKTVPGDMRAGDVRFPRPEGRSASA